MNSSKANPCNHGGLQPVIVPERIFQRSSVNPMNLRRSNLYLQAGKGKAVVAPPAAAGSLSEGTLLSRE